MSADDTAPDLEPTAVPGDLSHHAEAATPDPTDLAAGASKAELRAAAAAAAELFGAPASE